MTDMFPKTKPELQQPPNGPGKTGIGLYGDGPDPDIRVKLSGPLREATVLQQSIIDGDPHLSSLLNKEGFGFLDRVRMFLLTGPADADVDGVVALYEDNSAPVCGRLQQPISIPRGDRFLMALVDESIYSVNRELKASQSPALASQVPTGKIEDFDTLAFS